ncbi:hypothetical protein ABSA28_00538 [Candidatus Hepatincolaceae symbiont of Richtersius coronifer]
MENNPLLKEGSSKGLANQTQENNVISKELKPSALDKLLNYNQGKDKKLPNDPFAEVRYKSEVEAKEKEYTDQLTSLYADVKSYFTKALGENSKTYLDRLSSISSLEDKTNYMAKEIIRKAYNNSPDINNFLDSCKSSVLDKTSAFYIRYTDALKMLYKENQKVSEFYKVKRNLDLEDLKKLQYQMFDYRTKLKAVSQARDLDLLKAIQ